jgi:hypothetical protein
VCDFLQDAWLRDQQLIETRAALELFSQRPPGADQNAGLIAA